jgi:hypothetical protein
MLRTNRLTGAIVIIEVNRLVELLDMVRGTKAKRAVKLKAGERKCLQCDCAAAIGRRGLCEYHYNQFDTEKRKRLTKKARDKFDVDQVAAGNIFGSRRGKPPRSPNPFVSTF